MPSRKLFHKSLGGFDVELTDYVGDLGTPERRRVTTKYRVMVQVDASALSRLLGERAIRAKGSKARLCRGAVEVVNLGGVPAV